MRLRILRAVAIAAAAVVLGVAGAETSTLVDLTAERTLTLTDQTKDVVARLERPVKITAFLRRDEPGRVEAVALLTRYRQLSRRIAWRVVDPDDAPGEAVNFGIDPVLGGVVVVLGRRVEHAPAVTEHDVTAALARVRRTKVAEVCVTRGHGEAAMAEALALLSREGYGVRAVDLLADPAIPPSCVAVVVASPTAPLSAAALDALGQWVPGNGKLLVLADPSAVGVDLAPLLTPWGLSVRRGVVFEGDAQSVIARDVTAPIVRTYSSAHPIVQRLAPTYFPGVQAVEVDERAERSTPGLTLSRLADTTPASYLETEPLTATFDPATDAPGPITVAAAADRSRNDGTRITRTRVVLVGDAHFVSDQFLGQAGNATLFLRSIEWLTTGEAEAAISSHLAADRPLGLTDARVLYARLVTAGVVPAVFVLAGAIVWAARRDR